MEKIIITLIGGIIIFYCLFSNKTKKIALGVVAVFVVMMILGSRAPEDYSNPDKFSTEYKRVLVARGISLEEAGKILAAQTPLEKTGDMLMFSLALIAFCVLGLSESKEEDLRKIYEKSLMLSAAIAVYLLSLYAGMEFSLIPWMKSKKLVFGEENPEKSLNIQEKAAPI